MPPLAGEESLGYPSSARGWLGPGGLPGLQNRRRGVRGGGGGALAVEFNPVERMLPDVRRVMDVREMTSGGSTDPFRARFRGRLLIPSEQAYERLAPAFAREKLVLLLRQD